MLLNSLVHRLFLDHDIIFFFRQHYKNSQVLNTFENVMENGAFAPKMLHFPYTFQRDQKIAIMK